MSHRVPLLSILSAFAAVYVIWGSTYLAIAIAIESMPPFLMLTARYVVAGSVMMMWLLRRRRSMASVPQILNAMLIGAITLGIGTGTVAWAEKEITSGVAALLVTTVPLWMVFLDWRWFGSHRPRPQVFLGLAMGVVGVAVLAFPEMDGSTRGWAMLAVVTGSASWSVGSMHSKRMDLPADLMVSAAWQMLGGGLLLFVAGLIFGEVKQVQIASMTVESVSALLYLTIFGSIVAFSAYIWLLAHIPARQIASYAFVNPIVAVVLGAIIADELLTPRIGLAMVVLVSAVALIVYYGRTPRTPAAHAVECTPMPAAAVSSEHQSLD